MPATSRDTVSSPHMADAAAGVPDPVTAWAASPPHGLRSPWATGIPLCMHSPPARRQPHYPPPHPSRAISLPATVRSVAAARRFSEGLLAEWGLHELAGDTALLLSELVTNAVVHVPDAAGDIELALTRAQGHLIAQVTDTGGHLPRCGEAGPDSENGRGMWLVEQIATRWGHRPSARGKTVWFTLALPAPAR
ncbi:ATP-binding protein [Streptomyces olivoreticuli]|uniref:ATP-binding protein n=1 Tax=Streptomyces olivoreticuli TaxID=68246 RepID=UPI0013C2FF2A|nr:ATP-binding protein [Streptomyces olivoreticuli]